MSAQIIGRIYEVLTLVALEGEPHFLRRGEVVQFQPQLSDLSVVPDIVISKSGAPSSVFLLSHTNAEMASQKKFWRNIGELIDFRTALGPTARLINVVFDSNQKRKLAKLSALVFDAFLEVDRQTYGPELVRLAASVQKHVRRGADVQEIAAAVRSWLERNEIAAREVKRFGRDLRGMHVSSAPSRKDWWSAAKHRLSSRTPPQLPAVIAATALRRGLGRLLPVDDEVRMRRLLEHWRLGKKTTHPEYFLQLGLVVPAVGGERLASQEIKLLLRDYSDEEIVQCWQELRKASVALEQACYGIAEFEKTAVMWDFVVGRFRELCDASVMTAALQDCYRDPGRVLGTQLCLGHSERYGVWLFELVMTILKARTGRQQGYGYTRLAAECGFRFEIAATAGVVLSPFVQRKAELEPRLLSAIAVTLARRLKEVGGEWLAANREGVLSFHLRGLFEDKIYKSAPFDPICLLLKKALSGLRPVEETRCPTFLTDLAGAGVGTCSLLRVGDWVILWQSASGPHCNDKSKELAGRIGMLIVRAKAGEMVPRRVAFVADGDWTSKHFELLARAGADLIAYAHEADRLRIAVEAR